jgi:hypothetical protein
VVHTVAAPSGGVTAFLPLKGPARRRRYSCLQLIARSCRPAIGLRLSLDAAFALRNVLAIQIARGENVHKVQSVAPQFGFPLWVEMRPALDRRRPIRSSQVSAD